jgi:hypothetical protein
LVVVETISAAAAAVALGRTGVGARFWVDVLLNFCCFFREQPRCDSVALAWVLQRRNSAAQGERPP